MRILSFVFITLMSFSVSLMASAEWDISEEERRDSQQRMAELVETIEGLKIEDLERHRDAENDRYIRLAGECRSIKAAVIKLLDLARFSPNKRYSGDDNEPARKLLRVMISESSIQEPDKTQHLNAWIYYDYTMEQLMEFLNVYAEGELKYCARITPTPDMPQDERELGMYLSRCYLSYGEEFTKRCTILAETMVFGRTRKSPKISNAHALLSHRVSDDDTPGTSNNSFSSEENYDAFHAIPFAPESSSGDEESQNSNQGNFSDEYIRMNFREGENVN